MNEVTIIQLYEQGQSCKSIADQMNTYANKIRRILIKNDVPLRDKSKALKSHYEKNEHPSKGRQHTDEAKKKIGKKRSEAWQNLTEEEMEAVKEKSKTAWEARDQEDIKKMQEKGYKAMNEAGKTGSKPEKFFCKKIMEAGYDIKVHQYHMLKNEKLEIDIMIPKLRIAIEVDGPTHYMDTFGPKRLAAQQKSDAQKNGLIIQGGCYVIRVLIPKNSSKTFLEETSQKLLDTIEDIKNNVYDKERLITLWLKN